MQILDFGRGAGAFSRPGSSVGNHLFADSGPFGPAKQILADFLGSPPPRSHSVRLCYKNGPSVSSGRIGEGEVPPRRQILDASLALSEMFEQFEAMRMAERPRYLGETGKHLLFRTHA